MRYGMEVGVEENGMNEQTLQHYLYEHIPLSQAMQVEVVCVQDNAVILSAPLAPNINHRATVFGGSASAVAILAAWSLLHTRLQRAGIASRLVIQSNTMHYDLPITGRFTAHASLADESGWQRFLQMLQRKGKARIAVESVLDCNGSQVGRLRGEFVAFAGASD